MRRRLLTLAKFLVAVGLIVFLVAKGHLNFEVFAQLLTPKLVGLGFLLMGIAIWMQALRWQLLLTARGFTVTLPEAGKLLLIGTFFNYALPGAVGGDLVKAFYVAQDHPRRRLEAVLTVILDRLLGLFAMVGIAMTAIVCNWTVVNGQNQMRAMAIATFGLFGAMTLFGWAAFSERFGTRLRVEGLLRHLPLGESFTQIFRAIQAYGQSRGTIGAAILLSLAAQLVSVLFMMLVGWGLGETDMPFGAYFFAVPIGFMVSSLPIAPAGLGVGQLAFLFLFQLYSGRSSMLGQTAITAFQLALLIWSLPGVFFYLRRRSHAVQLESAES